MEKQSYDIIIIGGGPSGMMSAIQAKRTAPHLKVALIEKNDVLGKKLALTGGGRCNVTVDLDIQQFISHIPHHGKFLYPALSAFGPDKIMAFYESIGVSLKVEKHHRVFPSSNKSTTIIQALSKQLEELKVDCFLNQAVLQVNDQLVETNDYQLYYKALIIATGGQTFKKTGSTGDGYRFARYFNHPLTPLFPVEVPVNTVEDTKPLQGVSLYDVNMVLKDDKGKVKIALNYDLIFTHFGLSGPGILRMSSFIQPLLIKNKVPLIEINTLSHLSIDEVRQEIMALHKDKPNQSLLNSMNSVIKLPKSLTLYTIHLLNLNPQTRLTEVKKETLNKLIDQFTKLSFHVKSTLDFEKAFLTMGGIDLKSIQPSTMASKVHEHIYFCGELLDLNGWTGGYNLTIAFATGYLAGQSAASYMNQESF